MQMTDAEFSEYRNGLLKFIDDNKAWWENGGDFTPEVREKVSEIEAFIER